MISRFVVLAGVVLMLVIGVNVLIQTSHCKTPINRVNPVQVQPCEPPGCYYGFIKEHPAEEYRGQ